MSAPVYVIRAGKVRGQGKYLGKYLQSSVVGPPWGDAPWGDAQGAARFDSREEANVWIDSWCRVVRVAIVSNKTVTHGHHMASVASARLAALDEAERVCLTQAKAWMAEINGVGAGSAAVHLASAIAALKGAT